MLDTKYRPETFEEVLGQESSIDILRTLIQEGREFENSYVFSGPSGIGKTTLARILARAMLCENTTESGDPCGECKSCQEILEKGESPAFQELDAANNSGKEDIQKMLSDAEYYTVDGKERRIYLIDECHRLSNSAMDALLKPMEDSSSGTDDKRFVCLLCTTEPEKLRKTIKTRCLLFDINQPESGKIVDRLEWICQQEGIDYERKALETIVRHGKGHIRDMIHSMERVAHTGTVTVDQVEQQLGLSVVTTFYQILLSLRDNPSESFDRVSKVLQKTDPSSVYYGLAKVAMSSYRYGIGISVGFDHVEEDLADQLFQKYGDRLLFFAKKLLSSDQSINREVLMCDLTFLQRYLDGKVQPQMETIEVREEASDPPSESEDEGDGEDDDGEEEEIEKKALEHASDLCSQGQKYVNDESPRKKSSSGGSSNTDDPSKKESNLHEPGEETMKEYFENLS